jgi:hypothetical protein
MAWSLRKFAGGSLSVVAMAAYIAFTGWTVWPVEAGEIYRSVEGEFVIVELIPMPEKYQDKVWQILDVFAASPDSTFWCGPVRPNIHSWLSISVVCCDTTDFQVNYCSEAGDEIESLEFKDVEPSFYRINAENTNSTEPGLHMLQFRQSGVVVHEGKYAFPRPR